MQCSLISEGGIIIEYNSIIGRRNDKNALPAVEYPPTAWSWRIGC